MSVTCGIERDGSHGERAPPPLQGGPRGPTVTQGVALGWSPPRRWRERLEIILLRTIAVPVLMLYFVHALYLELEEGSLLTTFPQRFQSVARLMLDIKETYAIVVGLHGSPPAGQGEMLFDKLGKMRCARTRSIDLIT